MEVHCAANKSFEYNALATAVEFTNLFSGKLDGPDIVTVHNYVEAVVLL
jgi:hypothetical protein